MPVRRERPNTSHGAVDDTLTVDLESLQ